MLAAVAIVAIAASSAFATAPEFGRCVAATGTGKFTSSKCTVEAKTTAEQKFEWLPGVVKNKFKTKIKESTIATLETVGGTKITCTNETSTGEFVLGGNNKEVGKMIVKFNGCETSKLKCESPTAKETGEIITAPLGGPIGYETKPAELAKAHLANELHAETPGNIAEFECSGLKVEVRGSVLHKITANSMKLTATEKFTASKGKQKPEHFFGGSPKEHVLESNKNGGAFEQAGQTITGILTGEEKIEASTVN
jgi:hypothetical protein